MVVLILLLSSIQSFATTALITSLDVPLFEWPNTKAKILQYKRKGDEIYIKNNEMIQGSEDRFYTTITRSGRVAYVLQEHVFLEHKDSRELVQVPVARDTTDYRLEEPLPENYPFKNIEGYRGVFRASFGNPNYTNYPYKQTILDTSRTIANEATFIWSKRADLDQNERIYFGGNLSLYQSKIDHLLLTQKANQENLRLHIGPAISYDIYRSEKYRITTRFNILLSLYESIDLKITDSKTNESQSRLFESYFNLSSDLALEIQLPKSFFDLDSIAGINTKILLPRSYQTQDEVEYNDLWRQSNNFDQNAMAEVSFYIGLQSHY